MTDQPTLHEIAAHLDAAQQLAGQLTDPTSQTILLQAIEAAQRITARRLSPA